GRVALDSLIQGGAVARGEVGIAVVMDDHRVRALGEGADLVGGLPIAVERDVAAGQGRAVNDEVHRTGGRAAGGRDGAHRGREGDLRAEGGRVAGGDDAGRRAALVDGLAVEQRAVAADEIAAAAVDGLHRVRAARDGER